MDVGSGSGKSFTGPVTVASDFCVVFQEPSSESWPRSPQSSESQDHKSLSHFPRVM